MTACRLEVFESSHLYVMRKEPDMDPNPNRSESRKTVLSVKFLALTRMLKLPKQSPFTVHFPHLFQNFQPTLADEVCSVVMKLQVFKLSLL